MICVCCLNKLFTAHIEDEHININIDTLIYYLYIVIITCSKLRLLNACIDRTTESNKP